MSERIMIVIILKLINWKGEDIGFKKGLITGSPS